MDLFRTEKFRFAERKKELLNVITFVADFAKSLPYILYIRVGVYLSTDSPSVIIGGKCWFVLVVKKAVVFFQDTTAIFFRFANTCKVLLLALRLIVL